MKVYIVAEDGYDNADPLGVFSTRKVAKAFADAVGAYVHVREVYDTIPAQVTIYVSERVGGTIREFSYPLWPWEKDPAERPVVAVMPVWVRRWYGGIRVIGTNEADVRARFRELLGERQP